MHANAASARWDVVGIGENSVDAVFRGGERRLLPGGQVATTLATCAALGLRTAYIGTFGDDDNGRLIRTTLESRGVDLSPAQTRPASNRRAIILVDDDGERTVFWQRDAVLGLTTRDIVPDVVTRTQVLHVDGVDEDAALAAARLAREAGRHVTTDIDRVTERTRELVSAATIPILAEHVPQALTGESDPERALRTLRRTHDGLLCVTLGVRGSMLLDGNRLVEAPAFRVTAVDTTGAGDVFRGAFIVALLRGDPPEAMLRYANAAAAVSCTREGAIGGVPLREEIDALARV
jgi:sugar/nucleoside kinase (ribokinase family)